MTRFLPLLAFSFSLITPCLAAGDGFPGIEALMGPEKYRAAGLEKLSPAEREALDLWLIEYTARDSATIRRTSEAVRKTGRELVIRARLSPAFSGWSGDTVFSLDNGQVWKQRLKGRFTYTGGDRAIEIKKNVLGFYKMTHLASGRSVGVTRLE